MKSSKKINREGLTLEKLRTMKGYENVTDEEGEKIVDSVKQLAWLLCDHLMEQERKKRRKENF